MTPYLIALAFILALAALPFIHWLRQPEQPAGIDSDELPEPTPPVLVRARAPLSREDVRRIIAGWEPSDPRRMALEDLIDVFIAEHIRAVSRHDITPDARTYAAGGLETISQFTAWLWSWGEKEIPLRGPRPPE